jgi:uncharacterized protein YfiM (DUF2279 family)
MSARKSLVASAGGAAVARSREIAVSRVEMIGLQARVSAKSRGILI